jgi:hypothetical protein
MGEALLDQLLSGQGMPTLRKPLELIIADIPSKTEVLSQSALPFASDLLTVRVVRL